MVGGLSRGLKRCPFCGSSRIEAGIGLLDEYYVECQECGAMISRCNASEAEVIAAWNHRTEGSWEAADHE